MIDITQNIENYIVDKNRILWKNLSNKHVIKLFYDQKENSWLVKNEGTNIKIICPNLEINYSSFTHELLHIYIEDLGMTTYESFYDTYKDDPVFGSFLFINLFGWIHNFACHKKMFPYYEELGFSEYEFVQQRIDYSLKRHYKIYIFMKIQKLNMFGIDQFLGNFFALKNNVVTLDKPKCLRFLKKLRKINPELYDIADEFDCKWEESEHLNLIEPFNAFKIDLKNWLVKNYSRG